MLFKKEHHKWLALFDYILLLGIIAWSLYLFSHSPQDFVASLERHEGYILVGMVSFFGELAIASFLSVYPSLASLTIGGLHPVAAGLSAAVGMTLANIIYFYLGHKGRSLAENSSGLKKYIDSILHWINQGPKWFMPVFIWAYVGLTPFPNNLLTASTGLINYSFRKTLIPLFLGNATLMTLIGYLAVSGSQWIK